jgi:hypothetical protein
MTTKQRNSLMIELWPAAARAQGWKVSDRELRLRVLTIALHGNIKTLQDFQLAFERFQTSGDEPIASANDIGHGETFTTVKAVLKMLADDVAGTKEVGDPEINKARQKRHVILELIQCLSIYPVERPMGIDGAEAYAMAVIKGKFRRELSLEELTIRPFRHEGRVIPSQLDQLLWTLDRRLSDQPPAKSRREPGFRIAAGHTDHQMRQLARVRCKPTCKECFP